MEPWLLKQARDLLFDTYANSLTCFTGEEKAQYFSGTDFQGLDNVELEVFRRFLRQNNFSEIQIPLYKTLFQNC